MRIREITNGKKTAGTGTVACNTGVFGGALISTDGTNAATVTVRKTDANGELIVDSFTTKYSMFIGAPFAGADTLYWSLAGVGAGLQLYEWVD